MPFARKRNRVRVAPRGATKTEQHWKKFTSIDNMVKRYVSGDKSVIRKCHFADVTELPDNLHDFLTFNFNVAEAFDTLDESVRAKYATPSDLLAALETRKDEELFRKVGILKSFEKSATSAPATPAPATPAPAIVTAETSGAV